MPNSEGIVPIEGLTSVGSLAAQVASASPHALALASATLGALLGWALSCVVRSRAPRFVPDPGDPGHAPCNALQPPGATVVARSRGSRPSLNHDSVTGLANRTHFLDRLREAVGRCAAARQGVGLIVFDLEEFGAFNDEYGPEAGDRLLAEVAERLREAVGSVATLGRIGNDEFAIMVEGVTDGAPVAEIAGRALAALRAAPDDPAPFAHAAAGFSVSRDGWTEAPELFRNAQLALTRAKSGVRGECVEFGDEMRQAYEDQRGIAYDLEAGLTNEEFELYYQPLVRLCDGEVTGYEALVRWHHPVRGLVGPGTFVPAADRNGLIRPLGRWIMAAAVRQLQAWTAQAGPTPYVSINVSPTQLADPGLLDFVAETLAAAGIDPARVQIEVTESSVMRDPVQAVAVLRALNHLGVRIALDDFGTGHSTLALLKDLPIHVVKLDQAFVHSLENDVRGVAVVRALLALCAELGVEVTAEGVETEAQRAILRRVGCTSGQGLLFGAAAPVPERRAA